MTGCCTGVVVRLKEMNPCVIGVHCAAHRLKLAVKKVLDVKKFFNILIQLFDFFDNSAVQMAWLEAVQSLIEERGHLLASCRTRWLSTERSITHLKKCYSSVVLSLQREAEQRSDAKAVGLSSLVTEHRFVCTSAM